MPIGSVDRMSVNEEAIVLIFDGTNHWNGAVIDGMSGASAGSAGF
jgi:hypothetical protein